MTGAIWQGKTLTYQVLYPDGYREGVAYPVVFCLHGYGANRDDLTGLAERLESRGYLYVLPDGPVAAFDGIDPTLRTWYERGGTESAAAVGEALAALDGLVQEVLQRYRTPPGRALLLGFSQGGAVALRYGLARPETFAGIGVLSGSLRRVEELRAGLPQRRTQPIFVGHGRRDELVPPEVSRRLVAFLEGEGYRPVYRVYAMGHYISPGVIEDLRAWVKGVLPPASAP